MDEEIIGESRDNIFVILNSSYAVVAQYSSLEPGLFLDGHDFELLDDDETLLQVTKRTYYTEHNFRIEEGVLQELNLTNNVMQVMQ